MKIPINCDGVLLQCNYMILCKKLNFKIRPSTFAQRAHGIPVVLNTDLQPPTSFPQPDFIGKRAERCKLNCLDSKESTLDVKFAKIKRQNVTEITLLSLISLMTSTELNAMYLILTESDGNYFIQHKPKKCTIFPN